MSEAASTAVGSEGWLDHWHFRGARYAVLAIVVLSLPVAFLSLQPFMGPNYIFQILVVLYPVLLTGVFYSHLVNFCLRRKLAGVRWFLLTLSVLLLGSGIFNISFLVITQFSGKEDQDKVFAIFAIIVVGVHVLIAALLELIHRRWRRLYDVYMALVYIFLIVTEAFMSLLIVGIGFKEL